MKKTLDRLKPALCFIMAVFSATALYLNLKPVAVPVSGGFISKLIYDFQRSFTGNSFTAALMFVFLAVFYYKVSFKKSSVNQKVCSSVVSVLFAVFMVAGQSFAVANSMSILFAGCRCTLKTIIAFTGYVFLFYNLSEVIINFFLSPTKSEEKGKFPQWSVKSVFACAGILFTCWLGYLLIFYPGTSSKDLVYQMQEFYGMPDLFYKMSEVKVSDTVFLTDHQPIAHTIVIGLFVKAGEWLGSANYGLFLYCILQTVVTSITFAFSICYLAKLGVSRKYLKAALAIIALVPIFPFIAINLSKNSLNAYWSLLYVVCFFQYVNEPEKTKKSVWWNILLLASVVCQMLFIKNGVYVVLVSGIYLIIQLRRQWKTLVPIILVPVVLFMTVYTNVLLPACGVSPGSKNEMLSVPYQQTARFVRDYSDEVTPEEKEVLSEMFIYEKIPYEYNPTCVDNIKWHAFRVDNTVPFGDYIKVWFNQFLRHPMCYAEATANTAYGFFYPGSSGISLYYRINDIGDDIKPIKETVTFGNPDILAEARNSVKGIVQSLQKTPFGFFFMNGVFYMWACMFMCVVLIAAKKYKYLAVMTPTAVAALFCVLSPMNANGRYFIPIIYATLFSVGMTLYACKNDKNVQEEK